MVPPGTCIIRQRDTNSVFLKSPYTEIRRPHHLSGSVVDALAVRVAQPDLFLWKLRYRNYNT